MATPKKTSLRNTSSVVSSKLNEKRERKKKDFHYRPFTDNILECCCRGWYKNIPTVQRAPSVTWRSRCRRRCSFVRSLFSQRREASRIPKYQVRTRAGTRVRTRVRTRSRARSRTRVGIDSSRTRARTRAGTRGSTRVRTRARTRARTRVRT